MNNKMAIYAYLSTIESKPKSKQTSRTETESEIWRSFGGLPVGRGKEENGENVKGSRRTH